MEYELRTTPSYSLLEVFLQPDESVVAESGAMTWRSDSVEVTTSMRGGLGQAVRRNVLANESLFQNLFTARKEPGTVGVAPPQPGSIVHHDLAGHTLLIERSAYLASTPDVAIDTNFQGLSGLFNEGIFVLEASGMGTVFFSAYGDVEEVDVAGSYTVDTGHAVAWDSSLAYQITRGASSVRAFLFANQLMLRFVGNGKLWVQSRNPQALASWVYPFQRVRSKPKQVDRTS